MKVAVCGCGAFGSSVALSLAQRGHNVTLFDSASFPESMASSCDFNRIIRADYGDHSFYTEFAKEAIDLWRKWNSERLSEGHLPLYHEAGLLVASKRSLSEPSYEKDSYNMMKKFGFNPERLVEEPLQRRFPTWSQAHEYRDGYFNQNAGWAEASNAVVWMVEKCQKLGVKLVTGPSQGKVEHLIEEKTSRKVLGVKTCDGEYHYADLTIVACGAWIPSLVPETQPLMQAVGQPVVYLQTPPTSQPQFDSANFPVFLADIARTGFYGFPCLSQLRLESTRAQNVSQSQQASLNDFDLKGLLKVGNHGNGFISQIPTHDGRVCSQPIDTKPPQSAVDEILNFISSTFPALANAPLVHTKLCWYCDTFDANFFADFVPERGRSLFVAGGGSGHGFKYIGLIGDICADVIEGKPNKRASQFRWRVPHAAHNKESEACRLSSAPPTVLPHSSSL
eukprot:m.49097 g.49097  ORF g.49097 m.49097 type:complete len:450 (+) comp17877_c0_seq1:149-1498(+)